MSDDYVTRAPAMTTAPEPNKDVSGDGYNHLLRPSSPRAKALKTSIAQQIA